LTDEEIALILNNEGWEKEDAPTTAVEYSAPVNTPAPSGGETSIPDIQQQFPKMNADVRDQAMGFHNGGSLAEAKPLPAESTGIMAKSPGKNNYGTDLTVSMLKAAAKEVNRVVPNKVAFRVTSISAQYGGKLSPHSSHQSGLDIDVGFPSTDKTTVFGTACAPRDGNKCAAGATVSDAFDEKRFYLFQKSLNCADKAPVMAMFLDKVIKRHMCNWAKNNLDDLDQKNSCTAKIFRALHHENGHHNHIHIRLKCPGNESCSQNMIPLQAKTGC
jgi:penicillin-insensitive murein endopeptidase